jgi:hypothetical protein
MPAFARKKAPETAEPVAIPDDRLALHDAIVARGRAEVLVAKQKAAIEKADAQLYAGEDEIERLRKAIPLAIEADERRAASNLKGAKGTVSVGWTAESARNALKNAAARQEMTERARERLLSELKDLEDERATADNVVIVCVKGITVPVIEKLLAEVDAGRRRLAVAESILQLLMTTPLKGPPFHSGIKAINADAARTVCVGEFRKKSDEMRYTAPQAEHHEAIQSTLAVWSAALAALRQDATAELPKV